ncbi:DegT/DnrJ/EryC1/StrS family aminotransferase [Cycloclasticus zancles]|jgi:dTDP-4-amino-4,6-dideoxygalactose transaminase|uniref:Pyridoxal phosphate-dependent enzyme apparently involved in regulation of cell wall biogenesis n=1 Tax=Cycloclasticus zancles 78-ME TaxID=1198232 RepID=S5T4T0_9GAMM|nr:aminotransferase class I/II-fold pyridoxal phosphate-dependent enzyme [Cycloclasticus zancles]AGS38796.1 Pyridoxal phosphate-dependent enzyme apparently involved in regulation of cell wall biogenesis [Cycloclasticus zancles 78-ME]
MDIQVSRKEKLNDLAFFGGRCLFTEPKSTSSLAKPDFDSFLDYSEQFFKRQHYTNNGFLVKLLEKRLAEFHDTQFCVTFCSGFWGLVLAITSLGLKGKSEIIMPSLTYRRMADIAAWAKLKPHFCEVDPKTLSMNRYTAGECINSETALILAVHPLVNCCDVQGLVSLGLEHGIPVLFDSVESVYESTSIGKVGSFGDAECFSMHASKLLNGFEGGYVTTNNSELAQRLALLRSFGFEGQDNCAVAGGLNAKLNEIHAAMALTNLDEISQLAARNKRRYRQYQSELQAIPGIRLVEFDESFSTSYKNVVVELLDSWPLKRDETVDILNAENVLARAYYSPPLHRKRMSYPHVPASLSETDLLSERFMLLPCGDHVELGDIGEVIRILEFIGSNGVEIASRLEEREAS